jgi:hypothetical protein
MKPSLPLCGLLLLAASCGVSMAAPAANNVFEQLKTLSGDWRSTGKQSATVVNIRTIANGSSVVETWSMSPTRQSMTVYTMDGDRLLATHYCPQGNAPRLLWTHTDATGAHRFAFVDGANLQQPSGVHEHAFWLRLERDGTLTRSETYIRNDSEYDPARDTGSEESFIRASGLAPAALKPR